MRVLSKQGNALTVGHAGLSWADGFSTTEDAFMFTLKLSPPTSDIIHSSSLMYHLPDDSSQYVLKAMAWIFMDKAMSLRTQKNLQGSGVGTVIFHFERLRVEKPNLITRKLIAMVRSRGLPRRGGRVGTRLASEGEEVNSFIPRATMTNSSSSSEQDFLMSPDSYLPIRLRIPGRLLRSDIIVNMSIYLLEAAPEENSPSSQVPAELQSSEILLGDMEGRIFRMLRPLSAIAPPSQHQPTQVQENLIADALEQDALPPAQTTQASEEVHSATHLRLEEQFQWDEEMANWLDTSSPQHPSPPEDPNRPF